MEILKAEMGKNTFAQTFLELEKGQMNLDDCIDRMDKLESINDFHFERQITRLNGLFSNLIEEIQREWVRKVEELQKNQKSNAKCIKREKEHLILLNEDVKMKGEALYQQQSVFCLLKEEDSEWHLAAYKDFIEKLEEESLRVQNFGIKFSRFFRTGSTASELVSSCEQDYKISSIVPEVSLGLSALKSKIERGINLKSSQRMLKGRTSSCVFAKKMKSIGKHQRSHSEERTSQRETQSHGPSFLERDRETENLQREPGENGVDEETKCGAKRSLRCDKVERMRTLDDFNGTQTNHCFGLESNQKEPRETNLFRKVHEEQPVSFGYDHGLQEFQTKRKRAISSNGLPRRNSTSNGVENGNMAAFNAQFSPRFIFDYFDDTEIEEKPIKYKKIRKVSSRNTRLLHEDETQKENQVENNSYLGATWCSSHSQANLATGYSSNLSKVLEKPNEFAWSSQKPKKPVVNGVESNEHLLMNTSIAEHKRGPSGKKEALLGISLTNIKEETRGAFSAFKANSKKKLQIFKRGPTNNTSAFEPEATSKQQIGSPKPSSCSMKIFGKIQKKRKSVSPEGPKNKKRLFGDEKEHQPNNIGVSQHTWSKPCLAKSSAGNTGNSTLENSLKSNSLKSQNGIYKEYIGIKHSNHEQL